MNCRSSVRVRKAPSPYSSPGLCQISVCTTMAWCKQKFPVLDQGMGDLTCKGGEDERVKPLSTCNNRPKLEMPWRLTPPRNCFQNLVCTFVVSTPWDCPMKEKYLVFQLFQGANRLRFSSGRCWLVMELCSPTSCVCFQGICSAPTRQGGAAACAVGQHN